KDMSRIRSGIWLENQLHSHTIAEPLREELGQRLARELQGSANTSRDSFTIDLNQLPYRVFFRLLNPGSPFPPAYHVCLYSLDTETRTERELRGRILLFGVLALFGAF